MLGNHPQHQSSRLTDPIFYYMKTRCCNFEKYSYISLQLRDKERKATEERNPAISQAKRRQKMITNLPKLFNMIHFLVQSMNRSFITKEELVHKIIWNHCDMIDRSKQIISYSFR
jgi:hypothetical protein